MLFDKLIHYLKLDKQEFLFQFNSHPNYPSALAFSDTLNFMGVRNDAYELDKEYWDELPEEFIAIVDNSFSLVKKAGSHYSIYSDQAKTLNKEELFQKSTDFVLLFEKDHAESRPTVNYQPFIYAFFAAILVFSLFTQAWYETLFTVLSLAGVYISLEIFNQKFGNSSPVIGSICGETAGNQTVDSCNKIINQDKINFLGLKFSDFSLIYFTGITILAVFLPDTSLLVKGFTLVSLIAIGYSLYIQAFVEKTFCRVCLLIISILLLQLLTGLLFFEYAILSVKTALSAILLWGIIFTLVLYLNNTLEEKEKLQKSNAKNLRFKRNYDLFKRELLESEKIMFTDYETFSVGSKQPKLRISIVSNPYCGFCKDAHTIMENLLKRYPDDLAVQMRFNYNGDQQNPKLTRLLSDFMYVYRNKPEQEFLHLIDYWFKTKSEDQVHQKSDAREESEDLSLLTALSSENRDAGLNFTPIILINGYQFPDKYDREDIYYFIDELTEDEEIS
ncbi:vitamin K epoxide reductase family protein [uncultured Chryseobacterium sp.]|uniref:vitamin K epoxide reductase family protein n=1 Tax=uncultured Chryseobacterium sp. TaxID=259322 RepID=UPI0025E1D509|nr:vitamin K epoxide reductase family protein [uncultured Chryseobacterium sp.]